MLDAPRQDMESMMAVDAPRQQGAEPTRAQLLSWAARLVRAVCAPTPDEIAEPVRDVAFELKKLAEATDQAAAPPSWQAIETAPKDGTEVLLMSKTYKRVGNWARLRECWSIDALPPVAAPTHWMPLPAPPSSPPEERTA